MASLVKITNNNKIPVFSSDPDSVKQGVLASVGYSQYDVGYEAGKIVASLLKKEQKIADIAISTPDKYTTYISKKAAQKLDITIPNNLLKNIVE